MTEREIREAYQDHRDAVYRFALRLTGSAAAAEDILHDCFLSLLRNTDRCDISWVALRPFLLAVARNLARKYWRKEHRWDGVDEEAFIAEPIDPTAGETAELVEKAVQSLPELQREALVLFEFEDLSLEQIARIVNAETGTVKARLHRARENLRRMLAPLAPENRRRTCNR
jgi:RNA polymerase sigma-70 factor, ECF subfamily